MPIVNVFIPMHGIDPGLVTADKLLGRTTAPGEDPSVSARLDSLAVAIRNEWRIIGNASADGGLNHVELVKWFRDLNGATQGLTTLGAPKDRRFYIRTTDDPESNVITNVTDESAVDQLHDPDSPPLREAPPAHTRNKQGRSWHRR